MCGDRRHLDPGLEGGKRQRIPGLKCGEPLMLERTHGLRIWISNSCVLEKMAALPDQISPVVSESARFIGKVRGRVSNLNRSKEDTECRPLDIELASHSY
jgi:hypothetical protein